MSTPEEQKSPSETDAFLQELKEWQLSTFPDETTPDVFKHLKEEVRELEQCFTDSRARGELADMLMLTMCLCFRCGIDPIQAIREKHAINLKRKWQKTENGFRHVKEEQKSSISPAREAAESAVLRLGHRYTYSEAERATIVGEIERTISSAVAEVTRERDEAREELREPIHLNAEARYNLTVGGTYTEMSGKELCEAWKERDSLRRELAHYTAGGWCADNLPPSITDWNKTTDEAARLFREFEQTKELLREIRDGEVNPEDEADKFLRDHQPSELSKVRAELEQEKAKCAELERELATMREGGR